MGFEGLERRVEEVADVVAAEAASGFEEDGSAGNCRIGAPSRWQGEPCGMGSGDDLHVRYLANIWVRSAKDLNSRALPAGSRKNMVDCSPTSPAKRV